MSFNPSSFVPVIGVMFESAIMMNIANNMMKMTGDNLQRVSENKTEPVHKKIITQQKPIQKPPQKIINWWDTDEVNAHYKRIQQMYGLPQDW